MADTYRIIEYGDRFQVQVKFPFSEWQSSQLGIFRDLSLAIRAVKQVRIGQEVERNPKVVWSENE